MQQATDYWAFMARKQIEFDRNRFKPSLPPKDKTIPKKEKIEYLYEEYNGYVFRCGSLSHQIISVMQDGHFRTSSQIFSEIKEKSKKQTRDQCLKLVKKGLLTITKKNGKMNVYQWNCD